MAKRKKGVSIGEDKFDLTPMIDVVFLLLIYFLWTTNLVQEADMGITLPATVKPPPDVVLPDEHVIDILPNGEILLNGVPMDSPNSRSMRQLTNTLARLKMSSDRAEIKTSVTILADPASLHQRSIDVLNACTAAEIEMVSFAAN